MQTHEIYVDSIEFNLYLLKMKSEFLMEPDELMRKGDVVTMIENVKRKREKDIRKLTFKVIDVNRSIGKVQDTIVWSVLIKPLMNYKAQLRKEWEEFEKGLTQSDNQTNNDNF